jgi:hypothetical protein
MPGEPSRPGGRSPKNLSPLGTGGPISHAILIPHVEGKATSASKDRRPESQARSVSGETPSNVANWDCDSWSRRRTLRSSLVPASSAARGISVRQHHELHSRTKRQEVFH